ncbi:MAG: zinc-ribbon domain-containing protein [Actinomycetota bacterium]
MPCPSCGVPVDENDRFCGRCGAQLGEAVATEGQEFCTECGARLVAGDRYCPRCGTAVRGSLTEEVTLASVASEEEDFMAGWDDIPAAQMSEDAAVTETIATREHGGDTAVLTPPPGPPAPASSAPPTPAHALDRRPPANSFPLGATFALLGAVTVIVSSILKWRGPFEGDFPRDIPAVAILDPQATSGLNLGLVLLGIGTLGALVALLTMAVPFLKFVRRLIGLATLAIPVGFALRTADPLLADGRIGDLPTALGIGVYVAAAGAVTQMVAGRWFRR